MLISITPDLAGVPEKHRMWFAVAGKVPSRGNAVLVTLQSESGETAYPGVFTELTPPKRLKTNVGENKAMQPVHLKVALLLNDEQHTSLVSQLTLPRVSQLVVLPSGASTPLTHFCICLRRGYMWL